MVKLNSALRGARDGRWRKISGRGERRSSREKHRHNPPSRRPHTLRTGCLPNGGWQGTTHMVTQQTQRVQRHTFDKRANKGEQGNNPPPSPRRSEMGEGGTADTQIRAKRFHCRRVNTIRQGERGAASSRREDRRQCLTAPRTKKLGGDILSSLSQGDGLIPNWWTRLGFGHGSTRRGRVRTGSRLGTCRFTATVGRC